MKENSMENGRTSIPFEQQAHRMLRRTATALCVAGILCLAAAPVPAQPLPRRYAFAPPRFQPPKPPKPPRNNPSNKPPNAAPRGNSQNPPPANGAPAPNAAQNNGNQARPAPPPKQEHLQEWINAHQNLTVDQRVQALQQEPGFNQLPQATQQRMVQRLRELSAMSPEQQQTRTSSIEAMERLSPQQRQQMRGALLAISNMPEDRQRLVRKAFRDLREVPVEQRQAILNSENFRTQFSPYERSVLGNLLAVEPYLPPARPSDDLQYGGK